MAKFNIGDIVSPIDDKVCSLYGTPMQGKKYRVVRHSVHNYIFVDNIAAHTLREVRANLMVLAEHTEEYSLTF